jgi:hypothetical protein
MSIFNQLSLGPDRTVPRRRVVCRVPETGQVRSFMNGKISAYLSIFNDWDILPYALRSVAAYVDELIVVDGGYDWMIPFLDAVGRSSVRSDDRVYEAIESSGIPYHAICRTWPNELEKRVAGYAACTNDLILRVDADEVLFVDDKEMEAALLRGAAVGEMEMPNYVAPGWISRNRTLDAIERQCFLFDRKQVCPEIHLNYLWLILTVDQLPEAGVKPFPVYPTPLAFNAHLTNWRTPSTGASRAAFYVLNWMRQNGVPTIPSLQDKPLVDLQTLLDEVPADFFLSSLGWGRIASGMTESDTDRIFEKSPLNSVQEGTFASAYDELLSALATKNEISTEEEQKILPNYPIVFDLTSPRSCAAILRDNTLTVQFSTEIAVAEAKLLTYSAEAKSSLCTDILVEVEGRHVRLLGIPTNPQTLRQSVELAFWPTSSTKQHLFRVIP